MRRVLSVILYFALIMKPLFSRAQGALSQGLSDWELFLSSILFISISLVLIYLVKKRKSRYKLETEELKKKIDDIEDQAEHFREHEETMLKEKVKELKIQIEDMSLNYKALQDSLKKTKQDSLHNSMLLSNLGSSIRTNLNGIIGFSILLENEFALTEEDELFEYTRDIKTSGESLMYLLNNIIDINRIEANTLDIKESICDIHQLLDEVTAEYKAKLDEKNVKLVVQDEGIPVFLADTEVLKHVLINTIDNAVKFTEKGYVKISTAYHRELESVEIRIKDTGIGIDKAYLPDLFEPYRQYSLGYSKKNYQGIGLGLPLVKRLIEKMNGAIEIESEKTVGTTVTITIPFKKSAVVTAKEEQKQQSETAETKTETSIGLKKRNMNILIVDPEKLDGMLLKKMLEDYGEVYLASDSDDAVQRVEIFNSHNKNFDLIIIETGMNGLKTEKQKLLDVFKSKMKTVANTKFIALSSFPQLGEEEEMMNHGFDGYVAKPVVKQNLFKIINNVFVNEQIS